MDQKSKEKYTYSHGYSIENICSMVACIFAATLLFLEYAENSQLWILVVATFCAGLALFSIDLVATKISIYDDNDYLYIKPCQPITFKKKYRFKRSEVLKARVDTTKRMTRYGPIVTHVVVLITKDGERHHVLIPRSKEEATFIKNELSRRRHA